MANEETKVIKESPCEQYIVDRVKALEEENTFLKGQLENKTAWCNELKNAIIKGMARFDYQEETTTGNYKHLVLYFNGGFVALENTNNLDVLKGIVELIDLAKQLCE